MEVVVLTERIPVSTAGFNDIVNITEAIKKMISSKGLLNGHMLLFIDGSTAAISTIEYEPGLQKDLPELMEKIAPMSQRYHHDDTWHDGNGYAHLRSTLMGCSLTVPVLQGKPLLGTWQQIILVDFDNGPRQRHVVAQFVGQRESQG